MIHHFRPRARAMILLGEELIKDDLTAIIELVKNSYDADATKVRLEISNKGRSFIRILDNGHGMTSEVVEKGWLEPATNYKFGKMDGKKKRSPGGRVFLGEKGIGRFACHRLAKKMTLITRGIISYHPLKLSEDEVKIIIDWTQFEDPEIYLDQVGIPFIVDKPKQFTDKAGTELFLEDLKDSWVEEKVERLKAVLVRLMYPFGSKPEMDIELVVDGFREVLDNAMADYAMRADYRMKGLLSTEGMFDGFFNDRKITEPVATHYFKEKRATCGPVEVELYIFDRTDINTLKRNMPLLETVMSEFGGVAIYRDGFRVLPYGEKGVDWLALDQRRISRIGYRLGNKNILGLVSISSDSNPYLKDKTNREGLIENQAYNDLKKLVFSAIEFVERERFKHKTKAKGIEANVNVAKHIEKLEKKLPKELQKEVKIIKSSYIEEKDKIEERMDILNQLSGIGLAAERTTHEFGHLVNRLKNAIVKLREFLNTHNLNKALEIVDTIERYVSYLERELKFLSPLYKASRATRKELNLIEVVNKSLFFFKENLKERGIDLKVEEKSPLIIKENEGLLLQTLINLLDNAIYWCAFGQRNPPLIKIVIDGKDKSLSVMDSGPGISEEDAPYIFEPLYSKKPNGRGLGLYIVDDILNARGHMISLIPNDDKEAAGAKFVIKFNVKGEDIVQ